MTKNVLNKLEFLGVVFVAIVGFPLIFASNAFAQLLAPAAPAASAGVPGTARMVSNKGTREANLG